MNAERLAAWFDAENLSGYEREYRFAPPRRWRFDFAWVDRKVAVEFNGGVWIIGRHNRGKGYLGDLEKMNQAQALGWRVFQYAPGMDLSRFLDQLKTALGEPDDHSEETER